MTIPSDGQTKCPECGAPCVPMTHLNLEPGVRYDVGSGVAARTDDCPKCAHRGHARRCECGCEWPFCYECQAPLRMRAGASTGNAGDAAPGNVVARTPLTSPTPAASVSGGVAARIDAQQKALRAAAQKVVDADDQRERAVRAKDYSAANEAEAAAWTAMAGLRAALRSIPHKETKDGD